MIEALTLLVTLYFTAVETQAELNVQAAGYEQVTATCRGWSCSWVGRSRRDGNWETGTVSCEPTTLECEVRE